MPETAREEAEARLRDLALKAHSRGPWTAETLDDEPTVNWTFDTEGYGPGHGPLAWCNHPEDAQYIAAVSPEVVLALLDEVASVRALLSVPETENWEYAWRDEQGHAWPYGARDTEDGASLDEVKWAAEQDWWDEPAATIHRRHPAIPASHWEPVPVEEDNR